MADVTVTVADVRPVGQCVIVRVEAAATITPGQAVYISGNGEASLADASAIGTAHAIGIVVGGKDGQVSFADGEMMDVVVLGKVTGFATNVTAGAQIYIDDDAGVMATSAGTCDVLIGVGWDTTTIFVQPHIVTTS